MTFMYTNICKTLGVRNSRPNRLRVATLFFGDVPGASVFTRFADRAKKQASIFLGVLKREEEILLRRYDAKIWCEGMMRRYDAKVRRSEDPQRKLSGKKNEFEYSTVFRNLNQENLSGTEYLGRPDN